MGLDAFGFGPVLVFFVFHSAAGRVLDQGRDAAVRWALGMLAGAIGSRCGRSKVMTRTPGEGSSTRTVRSACVPVRVRSACIESPLEISVLMLILPTSRTST